MRKLCWCTTSFSVAILFAVYLLPETSLFPAAAIFGLCSLLAWGFKGKARVRILFVTLGVAVGLSWTGCVDKWYRLPAQDLAGDTIQPLSLTVSDFPSATSYGVTFPATYEIPSSTTVKVQVYADEYAVDFCPGDIVSGVIQLASSDYIRGESVDYYKAKGIFLLGYAQGELTLEEHPVTIPLRYVPQYIAQKLKNLILQIFPDDVSGFMKALLTGDKRDLPTGVSVSFQRSGISHIIAVSGLHISFFASLLATIFGRQSRISATLSILMIFLFAAVAGNTPSAMRAAIMSSILLLAPLVRREPDKPTMLSVALALLLFFSPYAIASASLQLSFAAVAGIYLISEPLNSKWLGSLPKPNSFQNRTIGTAGGFLFPIISTTLGAILFTTPLTAFYFNSISLLGVLTNLLTLGVVSLTFVGGLLAAIAGMIYLPVGVIVAQIVAYPARWILFISRKISQFPFASVSLTSRYWMLWFLVACFICLMWLVWHKQIRTIVPIIALSLTFCGALFVDWLPLFRSSLVVSVLDVGQGSSTLFYSKGHAALVDCGGTGADDPGNVAADRLQAMGISHLDMLVLTHYHTDHTCGIFELLSRISVSQIILPDVTPDDEVRASILELAEKHGCEVKFLVEDFCKTMGQATFTIFAPIGAGGGNEEGLSLLCSADSFDTLVTGDMNSVVERRLVKYKDLPDIELLVVGHHGSKESTCEELLLALSPEKAVISSGYNNYGHPATETLERLGAAGCDIYLTKDMGTITFSYAGE